MAEKIAATCLMKRTPLAVVITVLVAPWNACINRADSKNKTGCRTNSSVQTAKGATIRRATKGKDPTLL